MYNEFMEYMMPTLVTVLAAVITALAGFAISYINKKKTALEATTDNATTKKYIDMISTTITDSVQMVNQTYTDELKKAGTFTKENQKEAFKKCYNNVINLLSTEAMNYLKIITTDVETYLTTQIEAEVNKNK